MCLKHCSCRGGGVIRRIQASLSQTALQMAFQREILSQKGRRMIKEDTLCGMTPPPTQGRMGLTKLGG